MEINQISTEELITELRTAAAHWLTNKHLLMLEELFRRLKMPTLKENFSHTVEFPTCKVGEYGPKAPKTET